MPCTPSLHAVEDALSLALLALVLGTRPAVTLAMMMNHLQEYFSITDEHVFIQRTRPDDFIVRFSHREDLERVLATPLPEGAHFSLWRRRWSHLIMGSFGAFWYHILIGMKGIPLHARSSEVV